MNKVKIRIRVLSSKLAKGPPYRDSLRLLPKMKKTTLFLKETLEELPLEEVQLKVLMLKRRSKLLKRQPRNLNKISR